MAPCGTCYHAYSSKSGLARHVCAKQTPVDAVGELAKAVARLTARVDEQEREIQALKRARGVFPPVAPLVFTKADMLTLLSEGLESFAEGRAWPVNVVGRAVYFHDAGAWVPMTDEHTRRLAADVTKQLSILLMAHIETLGLMHHDPEGRYVEYSLKIHGMQPGQLKKAILASCDRL